MIYVSMFSQDAIARHCGATRLILGSGGAINRRSGTSAEGRVLSTFLNEMDGVDARATDGVLVLGATNRPSQLDAALLRPGRFDNIIYVPPPDKEGRRAIIDMFCQIMRILKSRRRLTLLFYVNLHMNVD